MTRFALSNIALSAYDHADELNLLTGMGIEAVEVAPSRVWRDTWQGLTAGNVADYRQTIEKAGLSVVGLHSLFYDHPELGLFKDAKARAKTLDFLEHLSKVCRDLGGRTVIWGGGRRRGDVPEDEAYGEAVAFMGELTRRIEDHGTCFCFEPLGPGDTDFINSALESLRIVEAVDHPALAVQLDAKALAEKGEIEAGVFSAVAARLVHFHANDPGLAVVGSTEQVDHAALGAMLREIGYDGYISIEQRQLNETRPLDDIEQSADALRRFYGPPGDHAF
jgi:sugar phosphate isomerase/epimerase